jgi:hypothetical protein
MLVAIDPIGSLVPVGQVVFRLVGANCDPQLAGCERFDGKHCDLAGVDLTVLRRPDGSHRLPVRIIASGYEADGEAGFLPRAIVVFACFWPAPLPAVPAVHRVIGNDANRRSRDMESAAGGPANGFRRLGWVPLGSKKGLASPGPEPCGVARQGWQYGPAGNGLLEILRHRA